MRKEKVGFNNVSHYFRTMALKGGIVNLDMSDFKEVARPMRINSNNLRT